VYEESGGAKSVVTEKVLLPKIEGALILAQGANDTKIKAKIIDSVSAVTGLATHKIQVLEME
jgi:stage III sporulation protein AG